LFIDAVKGTQIARPVSDVPRIIAFVDDRPVVRIVIVATEDDGRRVSSYGTEGQLLQVTRMVRRDSVHAMRGKSGFTLPVASSSASTRRSPSWLGGLIASSYRTLSQLWAKLKLR